MEKLPPYFKAPTPSGTVDNSSATPPNEVGGLALFGGVLMVSRTGFAIAIRQRDSSIRLKQTPFPRAAGSKWLNGIPFIRGALMHHQMVDIAWEGFAFSASVLDQRSNDTRERNPHGGILLASIGLLVVLFLILPELIASLAGFPWSHDHSIAFHFVTSIIRFTILVLYVLILGIDKDLKSVFQYHGAEHQAVLAFEEGRDVTVARARLQDTIHDRCGSNFLALVALTLGFFLCIADWLLSNLLINTEEIPILLTAIVRLTVYTASVPIAFALCFELMRWINRYSNKRYIRWLLAPGRFLQRFTTRPPSDEQVEVGIIALLGALAIKDTDVRAKTFTLRGLEDDESAPGYQEPNLARPAQAASGMKGAD